jgi:hypothetical protein
LSHRRWLLVPRRAVKPWVTVRNTVSITPYWQRQHPDGAASAKVKSLVAQPNQTVDKPGREQWHSNSPAFVTK